MPGGDDMAAELAERLAGCAFGRPLHRLDITVTSERRLRAPSTSAPSTSRSGQPQGGGFVEEPLYRNLHPMIAKRLELWRLAQLRAASGSGRPRTSSCSAAVAHDNPADVRLFAIAEVRDLTPVLG